MRIAVAAPLIISLLMTLIMILIHTFALVAIIYFIREQHRLGRTGTRFWFDVAIVAGATLIAGAAHVLEIFVWAVAYVVCGEFRTRFHDLPNV